jgi:hypothetical protein
MKHSLSFIALGVLCTALAQPATAAERTSKPATGKRTDMTWEKMTWTMAEGRTQAYPYLLRIRQVPPGFPRQRFPQRLNIFWSLTDADENGYPTGGELQRLHAFEDRLVAVMESDQFAMLALITTGRREREFVFYTANPDEFLRRLTNIPQEHNPYPIKIHLNQDAQWRYYNGELERLPGS